MSGNAYQNIELLFQITNPSYFAFWFIVWQLSCLYVEKYCRCWVHCVWTWCLL